MQSFEGKSKNIIAILDEPFSPTYLVKKLYIYIYVGER